MTGYSGAMVEPTYMPIIGYPQAWSGGTDGMVTGEAILAQIQTPADLDKWHGKLKGKIVLMVQPPELRVSRPRRWRIATPMTNWPRLVPEILPTGGAGGTRRPRRQPRRWPT